MDKEHCRQTKPDNMGTLRAILAWSGFEHCEAGLDLATIYIETTCQTRIYA